MGLHAKNKGHLNRETTLLLVNYLFFPANKLA